MMMMMMMYIFVSEKLYELINNMMVKAFKLGKVHEKGTIIPWMDNESKLERDNLMKNILQLGSVNNIQRSKESQYRENKIQSLDQSAQNN